MCRRWLRWITWVPVLVASSAAAEPHATIPAAQVQIDDTSSVPTLFLVDVADGWSVGTVEVRDILLDGRRDLALRDGLGPVVFDHGALRIDRTRLRWSGTYQLVVRFALTAPQQPATHDDIPVSIVKLAPSLDTTPVTVEQTDYLAFERDDVVPLTIADTTGRVKLTKITATQQGVAMHGTAQTAIQMTASFDGMARDGRWIAKSSVVGTPPLGTTTGTLLVSAEQIDRPIAVSFNIVRHRWTGLIAVVFLLGGLLGRFIRSWARDTIETSKVADDSDSASSHLIELARVSLPADQRDLVAADNAIQHAVTTKNTDTLRAATASGLAIAKRIDEANAKHLEDNRTRLSQINDVAANVTAREIGIDTAAVQAGIAAVQAQLLARDVAVAAERLQGLEALFESHAQSVTTWIKKVRDAAATLAGAAVQAPIAIRRAVTADLLDGLDAARKRTNVVDQLVLVAPIVGDFDDKLELAERELKRLTAIARSTLTKADWFATSLAESSNMDASGTSGRAEALATALTTWVRVIRQQIDARRSDAGATKLVADADVALAAGAYDDLFRALNDLVVAPADSTLEALVVPHAASGHAAARRGPGSLATKLAIISHVRAPLDLASFVASSARKRKLVERIQKVLVFLVLPGLAWLAYHEAFVGTIGELVAIAATGFGTDFSVDVMIGKLADTAKK